MSTAVIVVAVIAAVVAGQLVVMRVWFPRRRRAVAGQLDSELLSENVVRSPEAGSYQGATAPGYPTVNNDGIIALTRQRLIFQALTGNRIEIPVADITGVCDADVADEAASAGRQHLIIQISSGEVGFCVDDNASWVASLATAGVIAADRSGRLSTATSSLLRKRRSVKAVLAVVFTSIGIASALVSAVSAALVAQSVSSKSHHAEGTVVDFSRDGRGYDPVVEFALPGGRPIRFDGWVASNLSAWEIGEPVPVRYNPDNPQEAIIDTYWQVWFVPTILGIVGTPFLVLGIAYGVATLAARRQKTCRPVNLDTTSQDAR